MNAHLASQMLADLREERLAVVLVPCKRGTMRMLRAVENRNPWWYRKLCGAFMRGPDSPKHRKHRQENHATVITRRGTINALRKIANGEKPNTIYAERLSWIMKKIQSHLDQVHAAYSEPQDEARA